MPWYMIDPFEGTSALALLSLSRGTLQTWYPHTHQFTQTQIHHVHTHKHNKAHKVPRVFVNTSYHTQTTHTHPLLQTNDLFLPWSPPCRMSFASVVLPVPSTWHTTHALKFAFHVCIRIGISRMYIHIQSNLVEVSFLSWLRCCALVSSCTLCCD